MVPNWSLMVQLTTRFSNAECLGLIGPYWFPESCSFPRLVNLAWALHGVGDSFLSSQPLPWPSISHKVGFWLLRISTIFYLGQTLKHVGIWLRSDIFTHGQLYVACSRVGNPEALKFAIKTDGKKNQSIQNPVFKEVLLWLGQRICIFFLVINVLFLQFCHLNGLCPTRRKAAVRLLWV